MSFEFSPQQQKVIAAGATTLAAAAVVAGVLVLLVFMVRFFATFNHVFLPLAVAGVMALVVEPWYQWLRYKAKLPVPLALAALFLSIGLPLVGAVVLFGALIVTQAMDLIEEVPRWTAEANEWLDDNRPRISRFFNEHPVGVKFKEWLQQPGGPIAGLLDLGLGVAASAGTGVLTSVVWLMGWIITPVYMAFFLLLPKPKPGSMSEAALPFLSADAREDVSFLSKEFVGLVVTFFRGQLLIAFLQGVLLAIGFGLVGLHYGILLGLILGFLNIIPYLGSMLGLAVCIPLAWVQIDGGPQLVALVLLVFALVQMIEGYYLTPKIMGDRTGLNPLVIIVAVFFWGSALNGILGMILAIPLTAFLVVFWRLAREKYFSPNPAAG